MRRYCDAGFSVLSKKDNTPREWVTCPLTSSAYLIKLLPIPPLEEPISRIISLAPQLSRNKLLSFQPKRNPHSLTPQQRTQPPISQATSRSGPSRVETQHRATTPAHPTRSPDTSARSPRERSTRRSALR
jgi:hypothetical protein